jgi:ankyrin repeat protein
MYVYIVLVTLACAGGFLDVVKILLSKGASINLGQSTPLMEASQEGHIELVQYLIENGMNIFSLINFYSIFYLQRCGYKTNNSNCRYRYFTFF